jgi:hypothetical protein
MKTLPPNEACPGCPRLGRCPLPAGGLSADDPRKARGRAPGARLLFSQGAAALLPPALGFTAGFALTGLFFPLSGGEFRAAMGAALMFLSALIVYFFRFPSDT